MMYISSRQAIGTILCALTFAGCHSSAAQRAVSPLVGSWQINSDKPAPMANLPQFTELRFKPNGKLEAAYVPAGGALAHVVASSPQTKREHDSYSLMGDSTVRIVEGSRALDYTYEIRDEKLYLTPPGADSPIVYAKL